MKRPSFQFYPSDWLRDTALRTCSIGARGLWIDMICYMHEGTPYGYLKVNHKVILPENLATMCGSTLEDVEGWLKELESAGVFSIDENGVIYSRRMIRDEQIRNSRASGGKLGGNPALMGSKKDNHKVNHKDNRNLTPSSSSSSSSSSSIETKPLSNKFDEFWSVWPSSSRKVGKMACLKKWEARKLDSIGDKIIAHVKSLKNTKSWLGGFEPAPMTYLNQSRWEDEEEVKKVEFDPKNPYAYFGHLYKPA